MPVASAGPITMAKARLSRLPWSTMVGCWVCSSIRRPATVTSCGPAAGGAGVPRSAAPSSATLTISRNPTRPSRLNRIIADLPAGVVQSQRARSIGPRRREVNQEVTSSRLGEYPTRRRMLAKKPVRSKSASALHMTP